ncbi:MAG TPA: tripartite tricarboxylate transporter substrate-binding protein [Burkholderiales bacterium]|nr:tripartite tricarboxylate transporter substrate-binding protein [Burkholderiales bacterium]
MGFPAITCQLLLIALLGAPAHPAGAQSYPARPIRLVAATSPGGITDFLARTAAANVGPMLGQNVVVDNRPGAAGNVGIEVAAKAPHDGYTLLMVAGGNIVITPFLYRSLAVDAMTALVPVFNMAEAPQLLIVTGSLPVRDVREFIALARASPGAISYASAGAGSTTHLAADHFARLAGVQLTHIPYKGVGPALIDLIAGRVQMLSVGLNPVQAHLRSGALKALAVAAKKRIAAVPEVPTSAEAGVPGYEMTTWFGVFAPKATDTDIVRLLNARLQAVIDEPKTRKLLLDAGMEPIGGSAQTFADRVRSDYRNWGQVVRASGVKLE